jgi:hypothetical protein
MKPFDFTTIFQYVSGPSLDFLAKILGVNTQHWHESELHSPVNFQCGNQTLNFIKVCLVSEFKHDTH